jgi:hypothetical protein
MILDDFRERFETGNPVFAWLAYHFCSKTKAPIPMWVNDYLAQAASGMVELIRQPPGRDVGVALASALGMKTKRGATGFLSAARRADQASELLRVYRMFRFAGCDHPTAWKKLTAASRLSDGFVLEKQTIQRRLDEHYPGWRRLDFEPPSLDSEP